MESYVFYHNGDKVNEIIDMIYSCDNVFICEGIGNIYNLIDYINNIHVSNVEITFDNFKGNKVRYIMSKVSLTKSIDNILDYNRFIISDKKAKIRGKFYDKMD